jgi:transcription elongation factor GreB
VSKAFTKDDDAGEAPLVVPRRAPLPEGVPNYVTEHGLAALHAELAELVAARAQKAEGRSDSELSRELLPLTARIAELEARIASATRVEVAAAGRDEVRFGAFVTVRNGSGVERTHQIVGVDEANAAEGRVAFVAPLARALLGKRAGDEAVVKTPHGEEELEVIAVRYD